MDKKVIYILTNPSFPEYVKIGYTNDLERRLKDLNRSECTPYAFRAYATLEVNYESADKDLHKIIDLINPQLRSVDRINEVERKREFYIMEAEDAYSILENIAKITGTTDKLTKFEISAAEKFDEEKAVRARRGSRFHFSEAGVPIGATLKYVDDPSIECTVISDTMVNYLGEDYYLSTLDKELGNRKWGRQGPNYFTYNGKTICELKRLNSIE